MADFKNPLNPYAAPSHSGGGFLSSLNQLNPLSGAADWLGLNDPDYKKAQVESMAEQGRKASGFADTGERGFGQLGGEATANREYLRRIARGDESVSAKQLQQSLQQGVGAQQAMAASARPSNATMAARTAAMNTGRLTSGLAGQQAIAGMQERQAAQQALQQALLQQRQQELMAATQGRQGAIAGFGGYAPPPSGKEQAMGYGRDLLSLLTMG